MDMWQPMSGRKFTIKDKWIGCNPKKHLGVNKWKVRGQVLLTNLDSTNLGGIKREREKEREFRERGSTLSLDFFGDRSIESRRDKRQS